MKTVDLLSAYMEMEFGSALIAFADGTLLEGEEIEFQSE
jgi:hypothetical protein